MVSNSFGVFEFIRYAIEQGADEIDVVIDRSLAVQGRWADVYAELKAMRLVCPIRMKTILAVGELGSLINVYKASMVAMLAGSDFIKTSTGKEVLNANLESGLVMVKAIRDFYKLSTHKVGLKPAGGIKTSSDAIAWMVLVQQELGEDWLNPGLFRIGASTLLDDVVSSMLTLK